MAIPDFQTVMLPLLEALQDGKEHTLRQLTASLADHYKLSDAEREEQLSSGNGVFSNRVSWAKLALKNAGLIDNPKRGVNIITEAGQKVLGEKPDSINCNYLKRFQPYLDSIGPKTTEAGGPEVTTIDESTHTPQELLDSSFETLRKATAEDLLARLKTCSPSFFEQVVVRLLRAMGYGVSGDATVTGKTGDAGIDGVIREDKLGLDVVCIQAKRWDGSVGRPILQGFVGSMDYYRAKKGVMLTTSYFTSDAHDFLKRIEGKQVALIDGATLVELMIQYNIGVKLTKLYELKEVSNDFFDEDEG
jgi:restriction system protein